MTNDVHNSPAFSIHYGIVGIASTRNQNRIILLHFPEWDTLSAREQPTASLTKEIRSR